MRRSLARLAAIASKELRHLRHDRLSLVLLVIFPFVQVTLFGYAINLDVRHLRAAVVDLADTNASRMLVEDAIASQVVDVVGRVNSPDALIQLLQQGDIKVGVLIPPDFGRRLRSGERPAAQLLVDGSDPTVEGVARQLLQMNTTRRGSIATGKTRPFELRTYYNPERRTAVSIVPALIGSILNLNMMLFTALALVRERERGNLEMLIATPVRTWELMLGKILPYVGIGLLQATLILLSGYLLFDVPVRGSLLDLYIASLLFVAAALSLGLLISTLAKTQFQALQITILFVLPSILLSGFMFPFEGMPMAAQYIGLCLPLTHFVRLCRGILLRAASLGEQWQECVALLSFTGIMLTIASARFRKRLD